MRNPNLPPRRIRDIRDRFFAKVEQPAYGSSCWLWTAATKVGYGWFGGGRRNPSVLAHRFAYKLLVGPFDDSLFVLHRCDNPRCVNPDHLWLGDHDDNSRDMVSKGRARNAHMGQTHCKRGHELTKENIYGGPGHRTCRTCNIAWQRIYRSRRIAV